MAENENFNARQRNYSIAYDNHNAGQDCRNSAEFSKMNGNINKKTVSEFNNRLNAERMNGNCGGSQARSNGQRKPKQFNHRVYKPVPRDLKVKANENPFVIHIDSNDIELCKTNMAKLYHMHHSTVHNVQLQRHLDMIAKGTDFFLSQQQMNVIQFHEDLRRYQESIGANR